MKKIILKIVLGILTAIAIMTLGFYFFLFLNPLDIYQSNLLKWIPIFIGAIATFCSGILNKNTPIKFLPLLFVPFCIFDLFSFFYVPFIFVLLLIGILVLMLTRNSIRKTHKVLSSLMILGIFFFFLFSQPLILLRADSEFDDQGKLTNANVLWNFDKDKVLTFPNHIVYDEEGTEFDLKNIKDDTYLITFWATWCPPCMHEKPELEKLKKELYKNTEIKFIDISFDSDIDKWKQFIKGKKTMGMQLISKKEKLTRRLLQISAIPMHYIVNPDGIYKEYESFEQAQKALKKLSVQK